MSNEAFSVANHARIWKKENQDNLKFLDNEKIAKLNKLLESPKEDPGYADKDIKEILDGLERELSGKFNQEFKDIKLAMGEMRANLRQIPGYPNEPDPILDKIFHTFDEWYEMMEVTRMIDSLQNSFNIFKNKIYPKLEVRLYALVNPQIYPVNLMEIVDSMPNLSVTSKDELDTLLGRIREEAIKKLNKGHEGK